MKLNLDKKVVESIMNGLKRNEEKYGKRYCPCRRVTGNEAEDAKIICPCIYREEEVKKDNKCLCGLFVK
ncbi:MAG: ferredoxin-thioredoxin reductase catalytic domain-containing protein [Patescibacteria group bacterium]